MRRCFLRAEWGIFLLTILVFGSSVLVADFVLLDDFKLIVDNPLLQIFDLSSLKGMFTTFDPDLYVPLTLLSYHLDRIIAGGFNPQVFHSTNLLLHAINAVLVARISTVLSGKRGVGLVVGALFAVHPLHTEAVMWASARKDLLSGAFVLGSVLCYLKAMKHKELFIASLVLFLCALLSKVSVVVLPVVLILLDWWRGNKLRWKMYAPYFVLSIIFGVIALIGMEGETSKGLVGTVLLGSRALLFYVQKLFVPIGLSVLVPYTADVSLANVELLVALIANLVCLVIVAYLAYRRQKGLFTAISLFTLLVLPSFGNFVKGNELPLDIYLASDRYAYLASIPIITVVVITILTLIHKKSIQLLSFFLLLSFFSFLSYQQAKTWQSTPALYLNVIEHYDNSHLAHNNLAAMLIDQGHIDPAIQQLQKSIAAKPNSNAYFNLGRIAEIRGSSQAAKAAYAEALRINPYRVSANIYLARILLAEGNQKEAMQYLDIALYIEPDNTEALKLLPN